MDCDSYEILFNVNILNNICWITIYLYIYIIISMLKNLLSYYYYDDTIE